jgi:hypothetical protein
MMFDMIQCLHLTCQTEINAPAAASLLFQDVLQRTKAGLCEAFDTRTHPRL